MRLTHLFKYYWPDNGGGVARAMDLVILSFKEWCKDGTRKSKEQDNNQQIITCWQEAGKAASKGIFNEVPVYRCKSLFEFASTQFSTQFIQVMDKKTKKSDVTIYNFPYPLVDLGVLFGKVHGKLVVWWHCDFATSKFGLLKNLYAPFVKNTLRKADKIVTCAEGNIRGSNLLRPFKDKCVVIPHAVDDWWAEDGEKVYAEWEKNIENNKFDTINIVFVGRFVWYKGIDYMLKAYKRLKGKVFSLTLVGDGPLLEEMKKLAKELHLENVIFTGSVSNEKKFNYIKSSDFMVLPSISEAESFANVQLEAMSLGKPVINTWLNSGVPDVCPNGVGGITVHPKNEEELYEAMKKLSFDDKLRIKYSQGAMQFAREHYRMNRLIESYKELFDELSK